MQPSMGCIVFVREVLHQRLMLEVQDRLFMRHGRWKSENAKDGYVDDSVQARLSVSKQLDL